MQAEPPKTILLVDDDSQVREFTAICLARGNFKIIQADSGAAALRVFEERRDQIDLVLTDMVMPGLFGDQLALRLWEMDPKLPVIFISANPPEALEPGINLEPGKNFLRKPFNVSDLLEAIKGKLLVLL